MSVSRARRRRGMVDPVGQHGAIGDASSNNTAALQAAINAALAMGGASSWATTPYENRRGQLDIPNGVFLSDALDLNPSAVVGASVELHGRGPRNTILARRTDVSSPGTSPLLTLTMAVSSFDLAGACLLSDLGLIGYAPRPTATAGRNAIGVYIDEAAFFTLRNLSMQGFDTAISTVDSLSYVIEGCKIAGMNTGLKAYGGASRKANAITVRDSWFSGCDTYCIDFSSGAGLHLNNVVMELSAVGVRVGAVGDGYAPNVIHGCWFEGNTSKGIDILAGAAQTSITGCSFDGVTDTINVASGAGVVVIKECKGVRISAASGTGAIYIDGPTCPSYIVSSDPSSRVVVRAA